MRGWTLALVMVVAGLCSGCGAALEEGRAADTEGRRGAEARSPTPLTDGAHTAAAVGEGMGPREDERLAAYGGEVRGPGTHVLFRGQSSILIGEKAPPPAPERPRSRGRVHVSFHKADLDNALRFLADSGRFNLVVESGLTGSVTAELRGVDAFDALVTIAEANGAAVRFDRGIVMVKKAPTGR